MISKLFVFNKIVLDISRHILTDKKSVTTMFMEKIILLLTVLYTPRQ